MIVFFIILGIILLTILFIICSTLKINIKELKIANKKIIKFNVKLTLNLFNKIPWLRITINKDRINKLKGSNKLKIINNILKTKILKDYQDIKAISIKDIKPILENIKKIKIEKTNIKLDIGTENAALTAYITGAIAAIISILLARKVTKLQYLITPVYTDKNYIFLSINCIIALKLVHIINIIKQLKGKEVYQNHGKTSNRRTYANSNG